MSDVVIQNLVKTYPGNTDRATDDVSLEIADGEFMVLLGPSGCGKTTLLRMIAGLELPDGGSVAIGGRDVTYQPAHQRGLSMVFQSYAVFPHRTVRDNIAFGLVMAKRDRAEVTRKVEWAADLLQLGRYLDRKPAQLSGGQRQRVAVARAIVMDADVLLMDEPLSNLDALLRLEFRTELKKIVQDLGTTTVYVTHDQGEALSLGDRVAVMRAGRIVQLGDPIAVYDSPADRFVGGFLGSPPMNFLAAKVDPDGTRLHVADDVVPAPPRPAPAAAGTCCSACARRTSACTPTTATSPRASRCWSPPGRPCSSPSTSATRRSRSPPPPRSAPAPATSSTSPSRPRPCGSTTPRPTTR